jgi:hypothetical protein
MRRQQRRIGRFGRDLPENALKFRRFQRLQHVTYPVRAFRMIGSGIMRQRRRMGEQRQPHCFTSASALRRMVKLNTPLTSLVATSAWPETLQKSLKSVSAPGSVANTRSFSPAAIDRNARAARSTGIGHFMNCASITLSIPAPCLWPWA